MLTTIQATLTQVNHSIIDHLITATHSMPCDLLFIYTLS